MSKFIAAFTALIVSLVLVPIAYAQSDLLTSLIDSGGSDLTLSIDPTMPDPHSIVRATVSSVYTDLTTSTITWLDNGSVIAQGVGLTSANISVGGLGSTSKIEVDVVGDRNESATLTIIPTKMDILYDADSYVPPFYEGRALPAIGTSVHLMAIPYFMRADGSLAPPSAITFTWKKNGRVVSQISGAGMNTASLPISLLDVPLHIEVDAAANDGSMSGSAFVTIPAADPSILLYEDNPLSGILYNNAIPANETMTDTEMTFAAIPLFAPAASPNDTKLSYAWTINDQAVVASSTNASEITVSADNVNTSAKLGLTVTHASDFMLNLIGSWTLVPQGMRSSNPFINPFSSF